VGRGIGQTETEAAMQLWQRVKQRDKQGNLMGIDIRVIYGDDTTLSQTGTRTTCVERTNLISRLMNGRLVRKTLGFSKQLAMLCAACVWEDVVYNLTRPVKTLRLEAYRTLTAVGYNDLPLIFEMICKPICCTNQIEG